MATTTWKKIEARTTFIRWVTRGDRTRYAIEQPQPKAGLVWSRYAFDGKLIEQSRGSFYDDMGAKTPGPGSYHPSAIVAAAMSVRKHCSKVRSWL